MTNKSFTAEEVREKAHACSLRGDNGAAAMLGAYAAMLERTTNSGEPLTLADLVILPDADTSPSTAEQALLYVFGKMDMSDWQHIMDKHLTPPWPLERHARAMGLFKKEAPADSGRVTDEMVEAACRGFYGERWLRMEKESPQRWMCAALTAALAAQAVTEPADSGRVGDDERQWRELLAIRVAGPMLYTDDGELSDSSVSPHIDFLRDSADTIASKLADRARAAFAAQGKRDDQTWDENAERLTREAGIGGGKVNPNATSMDDVFLPTAPPASPAGVPHQVRFAIERCLRSQEEIADRIEKANPGDPYAALMIREDIEVIGQYLSTISSEVGHCQCAACMVTHASDCAVHNMPAMPNGPCDCGAVSPAGAPDGIDAVEYVDLPPGYRMASRDGEYWPIFNGGYCTNHAFPTRELAALVAWKQAHEKLNRNMEGVRRLAAPPAPEGDGGAE